MHKIFTRSLIALPLAAAAFIAAPVAAQDNAGDKVRQVIVYGDDPAPAQSNSDEIVVVARLPEKDRYRIPEMFRNDPNKPSEQAWTNRVIALERAGAYGIDSCSPSGMGGFTGCMSRLINNAYAEKRQQDKVDWARMTAEQRQKRLDKIDAEAEAVEARVKAEEARKKAQSEAEAASPKN